MIKKCSIFLNNNSSGLFSILISQVLFPKGRQINNTDHGKNNDLNYVKKKKNCKLILEYLIEEQNCSSIRLT